MNMKLKPNVILGSGSIILEKEFVGVSVILFDLSPP